MRHPADLPYFRPNNNATRGQIAKIDSNAAGYADAPSGQTFQDVPPGSTFYTYTQRLTSRSIMQGYPAAALASRACRQDDPTSARTTTPPGGRQQDCRPTHSSQAALRPPTSGDSICTERNRKSLVL